MALTRRQRELFKEAEAVAALTKLNYHMIEEADPEARILLLRIAINKVIAETVTRHTLLDEILSDIIARYFFKVPRSARFGHLDMRRVGGAAHLSIHSTTLSVASG
jgi:hypothetical protein